MMHSVWQVSQLVSYIKNEIDNDQILHQLLVTGEISNLTKHKSGHYYFTLKDDKARMNCVMFSNYTRLIHFDLKEGSRVIAQCRVSVYEPGGNVQLYVNALQLDGIGDLYLQLEQLKRKMNEMGYFDPAHKKSLPQYPFDIALISAKEGAAKSDVITTISRRWPMAKITFYPSLVQGNDAAIQLIQTIQKADQKNHDVILLVRGGGSIEDLWAFNNEELAKCIFHAKTPIVSGVGHETDTTLVDYVSDARAATPTAAAELITPNWQEVKVLLYQKKKMLIKQLLQLYEQNEAHLHKVKTNAYIKNPFMLIENNVIHLDLKKNELESKANDLLNLINDLNKKRMSFFHISSTLLQENELLLNYKKKELLKVPDNISFFQKNEMQKKLKLLDAYSPLKILMRGYSLTRVDDLYISSINEVQNDDVLMTRVSDGFIYSKVTGKEKIHE